MKTAALNKRKRSPKIPRRKRVSTINMSLIGTSIEIMIKSKMRLWRE